MKITLADKVELIPRNAAGDPAFKWLKAEDATSDSTHEQSVRGDYPPAVLQVFTPEEVVELVNRCLYQLEYQQRSHTKRAAQQRALEEPVKVMLKRLYPGTSFARATPEQIKHCLAEIQKEETSK